MHARAPSTTGPNFCRWRCKVFQPRPRDTGRQRPERAVWRAERAEATRAIRLRRRVCRSLRKTRFLALAAFNHAVEIFFDLAFMFLKLARAIVFPALAPYRDRGLHSFDVILLVVRRLRQPTSCRFGL